MEAGKLRTYEITFKDDTDEITLIETGDSILTVLQRLKEENWKIDEITHVTET